MINASKKHMDLELEQVCAKAFVKDPCEKETRLETPPMDEIDDHF